MWASKFALLALHLVSGARHLNARVSLYKRVKPGSGRAERTSEPGREQSKPRSTHFTQMSSRSASCSGHPHFLGLHNINNLLFSKAHAHVRLQHVKSFFEVEKRTIAYCVRPYCRRKWFFPWKCHIVKEGPAALGGVQHANVANAAAAGGGTCRCLAARWAFLTLAAWIVLCEGVLRTLLALGTGALPQPQKASVEWFECLQKSRVNSGIQWMLES